MAALNKFLTKFFLLHIPAIRDALLFVNYFTHGDHEI